MLKPLKEQFHLKALWEVVSSILIKCVKDLTSISKAWEE